MGRRIAAWGNCRNSDPFEIRTVGKGIILLSMEAKIIKLDVMVRDFGNVLVNTRSLPRYSHKLLSMHQMVMFWVTKRAFSEGDSEVGLFSVWWL